MADLALPVAAAPRARRHRFTLGGGRGALVVGILMLAVVVIASLGAPLLTSYDPAALAPGSALLPPDATHWFGTNQYGQDVFARTLYAGRINLLIGVVIVGTALVIGTAVGLVSTWYGGWLDAIVGRVVDIGFAFPFLVLVIAVVGLRGPGLESLFIAVGAVAWIFYVRLIRADVLVVKEQNYVKAARMSGFGTPRILLRHVLPNVGGQLIVYATSDFVYALLLGASVSYLGLGVQPPMVEWGALVAEGRNFIGTQWWVALFPGLAIAFTGVAFALLGDGLAERLGSGGVER